MSSETTIEPTPAPKPPAERSARSAIGRRPLIVAIIVVGVILVAVAGILLVTHDSSKPKTGGIGSGVSQTEAKAMAMCGVVGGILEDPSAQAQPELGRRVQAILNVGNGSGDRYQGAVAKLSPTGDPATIIQTLKDLQALCQPTQPAG